MINATISDCGGDLRDPFEVLAEMATKMRIAPNVDAEHAGDAPADIDRVLALLHHGAKAFEHTPYLVEIDGQTHDLCGSAVAPADSKKAGSMAELSALTGWSPKA